MKEGTLAILSMFLIMVGIIIGFMGASSQNIWISFFGAFMVCLPIFGARHIKKEAKHE